MIKVVTLFLRSKSEIINYWVTYEFLTAARYKMDVFRAAAPCSVIEVNYGTIQQADIFFPQYKSLVRYFYCREL